ncbi:anti-sigma factor domain-containing protein [Acidaminobacter sp. JC074]|uniref:anti-sigma factor domain-containing protein n=1 Tax=Acidaminobacter sp. JC074 TaxID=2530199 RepID=UPI001F1018CE|nr:anti-sigma factor domain-containing protein [Acidaminobacter sp. JC074]
MKKGLVVKIKKDYAILLTDEHEFIRVHLKDDLMIGNKVYFVEEDIYENADSS